MRVKVKHKAITSTALISIADIVFLLLIFLLISSSFVTFTGIPIEVPTTQNAHVDLQRNLTLSINDRAEIFINDMRVSRNDLIPRLREHIERTPDITVVIQADQNIALKNVIELVDAAKSAGSSRFFIAAQMGARVE